MVKLGEFEVSATELAEELGVSRGTVYGWRGDPPAWVLSYLGMKERLRVSEEVVECWRRLFESMRS